ncbi:MAG: DUF5723 family protein [Bacteroidota bacterium]
MLCLGLGPGPAKLVVSQHMSGLSMSSYAGVNNVVTNPALMSNSRYYVDVNIVGAASFFHNNYAYFAGNEYNIFTFLKPRATFPLHDKEYGTGERAAYTIDNKKLKHVYFQGRLLGPSVMVAVNNHSFAFQSSIRTVSAFKDIPYDMANYFYYSLDYSPQHGIEYEHRDPVKSASLSWSELGLSWAYMFAKYNRAHWSVGISAKMLIGHAAYYVYLDHLDYYVPNDDDLYVRDVTGETAYSFPIDYETNALDNGSLMKGMGMGLDFGLSYIHTERGHSNARYRSLCRQQYYGYKYRVGISLMDFGWIRYHNDARKYVFENNEGVWYQVDTLKPYYNNLNYISDDINTRLCGVPDCALESRDFMMYLPLSLGMQFDYHYMDNWYVSGSFRVPIAYARSQVRSSQGIMIVPRMESETFEFGLPFTLHEFQQPIIGAYMRFYNITIGTDNIAGFLNSTHHYGFDLYFSLKISFLKGRCKRNTSRFCMDDF